VWEAARICPRPCNLTFDLTPDSIRDLIRSRIVAADTIRYSIRTEISDSLVPSIQNKTMLKYAKSDANWLKRVNDVDNQTQSPHFLGHPV